MEPSEQHENLPESSHKTTLSLLWPNISKNINPFLALRNHTINSLYEMTDQDIQLLTRSISKNLKRHQLASFKTIEFDFFWQESLTNKALSYMLNLLSHHLTHVENLSFVFKSFFFDDQYMENLGNTIYRSLPELKKLKIEFNDCENLTNKGLTCFFGKRYNQIKNLEKLVIAFHSFEDLTDNGMKLLIAGISKQFGDLKHLEINITGAFELTDNCLESIKKYVERMKKLEKFVFNLVWSSGMDRYAFYGLKEELEEKIKNVEMEMH